MPIATVTKNTERLDLTTLPEGYVVIRRMSFGEKLARQDEMLHMKTGLDNQLEMSVSNKTTTLGDYANLIIDHNLTDENERKLNFKNPTDVMNLDPRIGDEIGAFIDKINSFEDKPELKN